MTEKPKPKLGQLRPATNAELTDLAARRPELIRRGQELLAERKAKDVRVEATWSEKGRIEFCEGDNELEQSLSALAVRAALGQQTGGEQAFSAAMGQLEHVTRPRGEARGQSSEAFNAGLGIAAAIAPKDELEGALAIQIAGAHALAVEMMGRAKGTDNAEHLALYGNLANKTTRSCAQLIEALAKLRSGGKQQVIVKHVYVDARGGQNIIASQVAGGGGAIESGAQPHEPSAFPSPEAAGSAEVWSEDAGWLALQAPGHPGPEALPIARRIEPRRTARASQRKLEGRTVDERGEGAAPARCRGAPRHSRTD